MRFLSIVLATTLALAGSTLAGAASTPEIDREDVGATRLRPEADAADPVFAPEPIERGRPRHVALADEDSASIAAAGDGVVIGTLVFAGAPLEGIEIEFWNPARDESYLLTTDEDGDFAAALPAGRYYLDWWSIDDDLFYLEQTLRPKVVAGKTLSLSLSAGSYEDALAFAWPASTDEEFFTVYFYEEGTEFEFDPLYACDVFMDEGEMDCDVPSIGFTAIFEDEDDFDLYVVPEDSDPFIIYGVEADDHPYALVTLYFEDTLGGIEIDLGNAAEDLIFDGDSYWYSFEIFAGKTSVGDCSVSYEDFESSVSCWGPGLRDDGGDGMEFLLPAGTYSMVLHSEGAKDVSVKKVVVTAGSWKSVVANFVPNVVTVTVSGTGATDAYVSLTAFASSNDLMYYSWAEVVSGTATFRWVPSGTVVVEGVSGVSTYGEAEKTGYAGGPLKLKVALK